MQRSPAAPVSPATPRAGSRGAWLTLLLAAGLGVAMGAPAPAVAHGTASSPGSDSGTSPTVFDVPRRTNPLATVDDSDALRTPQSTVAFFLEAARAGDWRAAGRTFDVRRLENLTAEEVATLARTLHEVLLQEPGVDWTLLPDRPDGLDEGSAVGGNAPMIGEARRSISLGTIDLSGRPAPVRVNRLAPEDGSPRWLFAAGTVRDIEPDVDRIRETFLKLIRERLLAWLREVEDGAWLPRRRAVLEPSAAARSRERGDHEDDERWSTREAIAGALPDRD